MMIDVHLEQLLEECIKNIRGQHFAPNDFKEIQDKIIMLAVTLSHAQHPDFIKNAYPLKLTINR